MRLIGLPLGGSAIPFHCIELRLVISKKIEAGRRGSTAGASPAKSAAPERGVESVTR
jgi:hypothetical protein